MNLKTVAKSVSNSGRDDSRGKAARGMDRLEEEAVVSSMASTHGAAMGNKDTQQTSSAGAQRDGDQIRVAMREDPELDRRIIEGMLSDRDDLFQEMAREGWNEGQVIRRAAELGLSEALLRQVRGVVADLAGERPGQRAMPSTMGARTCLCCDRVFLSTGPGNRLCMRCRGGDAGLAQF